MGMILGHRLAHDAGRLFEGAVRTQADLVHGVENAALYRLEAVPHVGQGPIYDDVHRKVEVGAAHLLLKPDRDDLAFLKLHRHNISHLHVVARLVYQL